MHISEGILPFPWALCWFCVATLFLAVGLCRLAVCTLSSKSAKPGLTLAAIGLCIIASVLISPPLYAAAAESHGDGKWQGVDEAVVEKIAGAHHREARPPLINMGQGDLLLFVFLAAGAAGGFITGYYWRKLMEQRGH
jgi:hypothetical protein